MGALCKLKIMRFDFLKKFTKNIRNGQIFYVYCTCKITKIEKNTFLNTDDTDIVKLPLFYSVRSWVSIYAFKVSFPHMFIEIPGGMYTHMSVLSTKLHENSGFCTKRASTPRVVQIRHKCLDPWSVNFKI